MSTVQDGEIAIWVCPEDHEVKEWPFPGGPPPDREICGECGKDYVKRCPNTECPNPIYHWTDHDTKFHACRTAIPWAFYAEQRPQWDWPAHQSLLVGRTTLSHAERFIQDRYFPVNQVKVEIPKELTPQERQDLIVPPSERLPAVPERGDVATIYLKSEDREGISLSNINRLVGRANAVIERRERVVVRRILSFFVARGRTVGKGADKGLEDAAAFIVKWAVLGGIGLLAGFLGWVVIFK